MRWAAVAGLAAGLSLAAYGWPAAAYAVAAAACGWLARHDRS